MDLPISATVDSYSTIKVKCCHCEVINKITILNSESPGSYDGFECWWCGKTSLIGNYYGKIEDEDWIDFRRIKDSDDPFDGLDIENGESDEI